MARTRFILAWLGVLFIVVMVIFPLYWGVRTALVDNTNRQFLPTELVNIFAITLPWVELVAGVMIAIGFRARAASLLMALMMIAFIIALGSALGRGLEMSCGCFAPGVGEEDPISGMTMLRDSFWLVLTLYVLFLDRSPLGVDRWLTNRRAAAA